MSEKSRLSAVLLCLWLGVFGAHRFYVGKIGTGVVWLLTFGCLGIGWLVDFILLCIGQFYDKNNKAVIVWMRRVDAEGKVQDYLV